ncbi:hypothetical protein Tco_0439995 [Tanacetum coccineum]
MRSERALICVLLDGWRVFARTRSDARAARLHYMDREIRHDLERYVGYRITDSWDEIVEAMQGTPVVTNVAEFSQRMTKFETKGIKDRHREHARTARLTGRSARAPARAPVREDWGRSWTRGIALGCRGMCPKWHQIQQSWIRFPRDSKSHGKCNMLTMRGTGSGQSLLVLRCGVKGISKGSVKEEEQQQCGNQGRNWNAPAKVYAGRQRAGMTDSKSVGTFFKQSLSLCLIDMCDRSLYYLFSSQLIYAIT